MSNKSVFPSEESLAIYTTSRQRIPRLPFEAMKDTILGKNYTLSLAFVGNTRSRSLNTRLRGKNKPANVLSFPLSRNEGEIVIDLYHAKKEARHFSMSYKKFIGYLFIHGMLHLKGLQHGGTMEKEEIRICDLFSL